MYPVVSIAHNGVIQQVRPGRTAGPYAGISIVVNPVVLHIGPFLDQVHSVTGVSSYLVALNDGGGGVRITKVLNTKATVILD